jgi:hypothetical protein
MEDFSEAEDSTATAQDWYAHWLGPALHCAFRLLKSPSDDEAKAKLRWSAHQNTGNLNVIKNLQNAAQKLTCNHRFNSAIRIGLGNL